LRRHSSPKAAFLALALVPISILSVAACSTVAEPAPASTPGAAMCTADQLGQFAGNHPAEAPADQMDRFAGTLMQFQQATFDHLDPLASGAEIGPEAPALRDVPGLFQLPGHPAHAQGMRAEIGIATWLMKFSRAEKT